MIIGLFKDLLFVFIQQHSFTLTSYGKGPATHVLLKPGDDNVILPRPVITRCVVVWFPGTHKDKQIKV